MFSLKNPTASFIKTTKGVLLSPVEFFRSVSWGSVPIIDSLAFTLVCSFVPAIIRFIVPSLSGQSSMMTPFAGRLPLSGMQFVPFFLVTPLVSLIFLAVASILVWAVVRYIFKSNTSYNALFAVMAAVSATQLLSWIPVIGVLLSLYALVLSVIGIREAASLTTVQAVIAYILSIILMGIVSLALSAALLGVYFNSSNPYPL